VVTSLTQRRLQVSINLLRENKIYFAPASTFENLIKHATSISMRVVTLSNLPRAIPTRCACGFLDGLRSALCLGAASGRQRQELQPIRPRADLLTIRLKCSKSVLSRAHQVRPPHSKVRGVHHYVPHPRRSVRPAAWGSLGRPSSAPLGRPSANPILAALLARLDKHLRRESYSNSVHHPSSRRVPPRSISLLRAANIIP